MCGVVGVFGVENANEITLGMMEALHHRGSQSTGCVLVGDGEPLYEREPGEVSNLMHRLRKITPPNNSLIGIGHLRYGTSGSRDGMENAQPLYAKKDPWEIYIAHNGDTPFCDEMRRWLLDQGMMFNTTTDTECILKYIGLSKAEDPIAAILEGLSFYRGTYAITILLKDKNSWKIIAARDHSGNRPLFLGKLEAGWLIASEDVAFEAVGGEAVREIEQGELVVISESGLRRKVIPERSGEKTLLKRCIFENIYFSYPDSNTFGVSVSDFREELGWIMARRLRFLVMPDDVITNVPDSSNSFLDGFAEGLSKFPKRAITRKHGYRSFTQANQARRASTIRKKFSFNGKKVRGKRVWVTDDSIVRGNTSRKIIRVLRSRGATWVGFVSSAPPIIGPCKKGIDFEDDLVAAKFLESGVPSVEKICREIEADYLVYSDINDLRLALQICGSEPSKFCYGCFENRDPVFGAW